jgi:acyl-coenzyme A synthetase/AMP-(fatty) acid ligase
VRVEFVDEIPRNPTGKILKRVLRDRFPGPAPA